MARRVEPRRFCLSKYEHEHNPYTLKSQAFSFVFPTFYIRIFNSYIRFASRPTCRKAPKSSFELDKKGPMH